MTQIQTIFSHIHKPFLHIEIQNTNTCILPVETAKKKGKKQDAFTVRRKKVLEGKG